MTQRLSEKSSSGAKYNLVSSEDDMDPATLQRMIARVESVSSELTDTKMQQLQLIRGSPAVVDRTVERLRGDTIKEILLNKSLSS